MVTRLIFWDERSLFFEQSFVSLHDGFVRAVAICKNTVVGGSVVEMLASVGAKSAPAMPKEVRIRCAKFCDPLNTRVAKTPSARQQCRPESFCKFGKILREVHYSLNNYRYFAIQNIQMICKVSG